MKILYIELFQVCSLVSNNCYFQDNKITHLIVSNHLELVGILLCLLDMISYHPHFNLAKK